MTRQLTRFQTFLDRSGRFIISASIGLSIVSLSSCISISNPDSQRELAEEARTTVTFPEDWKVEASDELLNSQWVETFGDVKLAEYVTEALLKNTDVLSAYEFVEASRAGLAISRADRLPEIGLTVSGSRTEQADDPFAIGPNGVDSDFTSLSANLTASWEPDFWGRIRNQIEIAEYDIEASEADFAAIRLSIAALTAEAYFNVVQAKQLVELSDDDVATQNRSLTLTERRYESGVTGRSDLSLTLSQLSAAKALRVSRVQQLAEIERQLETLLRRYPNAQIVTADTLPSLSVFGGAGDVEGIFFRRPDLQAAEARLAAQGLQVDLARKALLPSISIGSDANAGAGGVGDLFNVDALVVNFLSNLTAPIFQGGRLRANVKQQKAALRQLLQSYTGDVLQAFLEVENALAAESLLAEQEEALQDAMNEARDAETRLERRYAEGLATILELLDAQSRRLSSQGQLIVAQRERLSNRVQLHVALGSTPFANTNVTFNVTAP